jgi:hypothetical protein
MNLLIRRFAIVVITLVAISTLNNCAKNENDGNDKTDYSFNTIVDSSFYCSFYIGSEYHKLPYQLNLNMTFRIPQKDSTTLGYYFGYIDSATRDKFTLTLSKKFIITNNSEFDFNTPILDDLVLSNLNQKKNNLSIPFKWSIYDDNASDSTAGFSITFNDLDASTWGTRYVINNLPQDSIKSFYQDCGIYITSIKILDKNHYIYEGSFNAKLFSNWQHTYIRLSNGYFKVFKEY